MKEKCMRKSKRLSSAVAAVALAAVALGAVQPAQAAGQWKYGAVCIVPSICGSYSSWVTGFSSYEACVATRNGTAASPWGQWPYAVTGCVEY
jgi:hypothetical protein